MKLLVLEQNEVVSRIYKNIFNKKNYEADFAKNDSECIDRIEGNYDYVVINDPINDSQCILEAKIRKIRPSQKIFSLAPYIKYDGEYAHSETQEIIEKPFAMLNMVAKLESEKHS